MGTLLWAFNPSNQKFSIMKILLLLVGFTILTVKANPSDQYTAHGQLKAEVKDGKNLVVGTTWNQTGPFLNGTMNSQSFMSYLRYFWTDILNRVSTQFLFREKEEQR